MPPAAFTFGDFEVKEEAKTMINPIRISNKPILSKFSILCHEEKDNCSNCN